MEEYESLWIDNLRLQVRDEVWAHSNTKYIKIKQEYLSIPSWINFKLISLKGKNLNKLTSYKLY